MEGSYNRAIAQLAKAYGTKMTWTDCMRAIAQLRHRQNSQDEVEEDWSAQLRTEPKTENTEQVIENTRN